MTDTVSTRITNYGLLSSESIPKARYVPALKNGGGLSRWSVE